MKLKNLLIVIVIIAALSAVAYIVRRPGTPARADDRLGQPLAAQAFIEQAAQLRLTDQGKTVTLKRQTDGAWSVPGYFDLPADFAKLSGFITSLGDAKLERLVTSNPERLARLDFKDTKISLLDAGDKEVWAVTLGKNAETGGGRYVRFGTENKAYLTNLSAWLDVEPKNWADTRILDLKPDDIAKIEIPLDEGGPVTISRTKKEAAWASEKTSAGERINVGKLATLLGSVGSLRFSDTANLADAAVSAAKAHERVFRLTTFEGKTYTVALGRKPEEKKIKPLAVAPAALSEQKPDSAKTGEIKPQPEKKADKPKPAAPEYETVPAGPVFVTINCSEATAAVNTLMQKRAFQLSEYTFNSLPRITADLFEPVPLTPPDSAKPAEAKKP
jgi:hypothetical protein